MIIDLATPIRRERVRGFQPPWRTVFVYQCPKCKREIRMLANSFRGKTPVPSVGGISCDCDREQNLIPLPNDPDEREEAIDALCRQSIPKGGA